MLLVLGLVAPTLLWKESLLVSGHFLVNKVSNFTSKGGGLEFLGGYEEAKQRNFIPPLLLVDPYIDPKDSVQSKKWIIGKNLTKLHSALLPFKVRTNGEVYVPPGQTLHVLTSDWGGDDYFGGNPDLSALLVNLACTKIAEDKNINNVALSFYNPSWERGGKFDSTWKLLKSQDVSTKDLYRQIVGIMPPKLKLSHLGYAEKDEKEREMQREKELSMDVFERVNTRFKDWKKECRKLTEAKYRTNKREQKIMLQKIQQKQKPPDFGSPSPRGKKPIQTHLRNNSSTPPKKQGPL